MQYVIRGTQNDLTSCSLTGSEQYIGLCAVLPAECAPLCLCVIIIIVIINEYLEAGQWPSFSVRHNHFTYEVQQKLNLCYYYIATSGATCRLCNYDRDIQGGPKKLRQIFLAITLVNMDRF